MFARVRVSAVAGGAIEERDYRSSQTFDELAPDGSVARHHEAVDIRTKQWSAGVIGADIEVRVTDHLSAAPQFLPHLPYPAVSIVRPGVAVRWRF